MARQQASERLTGKGMERPPRWPVRTVGLVGVANLAVALGLLLASQAAGRTERGVASSTKCQRNDHALLLASYAPAFRTYDDPIEDSASAPDFCASELVTNDNQAITIGIHAHNRSGVAPGDVYSVFLNTDLNAKHWRGRSRGRVPNHTRRSRRAAETVGRSGLRRDVRDATANAVGP